MSRTFAPHAPLTLPGQALSVCPAILQWLQPVSGTTGKETKGGQYNKPQGSCVPMSFLGVELYLGMSD